MVRLEAAVGFVVLAPAGTPLKKTPSMAPGEEEKTPVLTPPAKLEGC